MVPLPEVWLPFDAPHLGWSLILYMGLQPCMEASAWHTLHVQDALWFSFVPITYFWLV